MLLSWTRSRILSRAPQATAGKRVMIVALARKLLVALWRYLETGLVPEGARFGPARFRPKAAA